MKYSDILGLAPTAFSVIIAIPLIVFNGYKYYQNRNHIVFTKRYASITIYEVIFAVLSFCFYAVAYFLFWKDPNSIIADILIFHNNLFMHLVKYCWIIRFFVLSYDLNVTNLLINYRWQSVINPSHAMQNTKLEWYLKKKSKYNNIKWIIKIFSPLLILPVIMDFMDTKLVASYLNYSNAEYNITNILDITLLMPSWIALLMIYATIPKLKDNFYISAELKRVIIMVILEVVGFSGVVVMNRIYALNFGSLSFVVTIENITTKTCDVILILISTYWVNKKVSRLIKRHNYAPKCIQNQFLPNINSNHVYLAMDNSINGDINQNQNLSVIEHAESTLEFVNCLSNQPYFECFADYFAKDLSINVLLAFIECIQFQQYVSHNNENMNEEKEDENDKLYKTIQFYDNMAKSQIVYRNNKDDANHTKLIAYELFLKYIEYGSYYEVAINDRDRENIIDIMMHKQEFMEEYNGDLQHLFNEMINELFEILLSSFSRFKTTSHYIKCKQFS